MFDPGTAFTTFDATLFADQSVLLAEVVVTFAFGCNWDKQLLSLPDHVRIESIHLFNEFWCGVEFPGNSNQRVSALYAVSIPGEPFFGR